MGYEGQRPICIGRSRMFLKPYRLFLKELFLQGFVEVDNFQISLVGLNKIYAISVFIGTFMIHFVTPARVYGLRRQMDTPFRNQLVFILTYQGPSRTFQSHYKIYLALLTEYETSVSKSNLILFHCLYFFSCFVGYFSRSVVTTELLLKT